MESILKCDRIVNDMERGIEARCLSLITRQQPVARDLRTVTASLKVVTDIERIGDHISDMAELFLRLNMPDMKAFSESLPVMAEETKRMVHNAVDAFVNRQMDDAKQVIQDDDQVDDLFNKVKSEIIGEIRTGLDDGEQTTDLLMAAKYFERIGDHATNIAEWVIFSLTGEHV